jgi:cell division protein FtsA
MDTAERLKLEYGDIGFGGDKKDYDEEIDLTKISDVDTTAISRKFLTEILRARYMEIFHYVNMELKKTGKDGMLPEGAVLTGGASKMRGLLPLARESLRLPASIGVPLDIDGIGGTSFADPSYTSVIGILLLADRYSTARKPFKINFSLSEILMSIRTFFSKIIP